MVDTGDENPTKATRGLAQLGTKIVETAKEHLTRHVSYIPAKTILDIQLTGPDTYPTRALRVMDRDAVKEVANMIRRGGMAPYLTGRLTSGLTMSYLKGYSIVEMLAVGGGRAVERYVEDIDAMISRGGRWLFLGKREFHIEYMRQEDTIYRGTKHIDAVHNRARANYDLQASPTLRPPRWSSSKIRLSVLTDEAYLGLQELPEEREVTDRETQETKERP